MSDIRDAAFKRGNEHAPLSAISGFEAGYRYALDAIKATEARIAELEAQLAKFSKRGPSTPPVVGETWWAECRYIGRSPVPPQEFEDSDEAETAP